MSAAAEELLRSDPGRAVRERQLVELIREGRRAGRLVDDLVLMARLDDRDPSSALLREDVDLTDLVGRIPLNMNVLDGGLVPRVMGLKEALRAFLDHRHEVLERRSQFRLAEIDRRLEVLAGYLGEDWLDLLHGETPFSVDG